MFLLALIGCSYDPTVGTLPDNVGQAFAPCQESEIRFLATKHNFQTVFEPCGNNQFGAFAWAPTGTHLYFQLGQTAYVMHASAEDKRTLTVPTPSPIGEAAWLSASQIAIPVGPEAADGKNRLAVFDLEQQSVFYREVPHASIQAVHKPATPGEALLVVAESEDAPRSLVRIALADGAVEPAAPWLTGFDTLDWVVTSGEDMQTPVPAEVAVVGRGNTVTLHDASSGEVWKTFEDATAGALHPKGRWLALEHLGEEVSIFYQRAWDDMSEAQRRREQARAEKLASGLPESYQKTVRPPAIALVDLTDGARWDLTSVQGEDFAWYTAQDYWASFIFWGFEGKQFKRNVLLGQMGSRLRATEIGREFLGVVPVND
ncbi:MAG: hypothetical protein KC656_29890, partial [Myxococcales bacterium]|nr:hypothetical protein [Myxococcales bacterium]